jgi:ABC-type Zn2+ transport system substrate-binding protein/surface adhesin
MTRLGDEMILELAASLGGMEKTAAKKDEKEEKEDKKDDKEKKDEKEEKEDKDDKKEDKKDKKKDAVMDVLNGLSKLAADLDEAGADEASSLVDDALRVIVNNLENEKKKVTADFKKEAFPINAIISAMKKLYEQTDPKFRYQVWTQLRGAVDQLKPQEGMQ